MSDHVETDTTACYRWPELHAGLLRGDYRLPLYLMRISPEHSQRLFVVPDDWDQML